MHFYEQLICLSCFFYLTSAHIAQLNDQSQFQANSLFICKNLGIACEKMDPSNVVLLKFSADFQTYSVMNTTNFSNQFDYPQSGVITTNGQSNCFLYFLQVNVLENPLERNITLFSLDFDTLELRSSEPATTKSPYTSSKNITLLKSGLDDIEQLSIRRVFFVRNTDIMFVDQTSLPKIKYVVISQISSVNGTIQTTSPYLVIFAYPVKNSTSIDPITTSTNSYKQELLLYNFERTSYYFIEPTFCALSLEIQHAAIFTKLSSCEIVQADILDIEAFLKYTESYLSIYACSSYWILGVFHCKYPNPAPLNIISNFPNNYSMGIGFIKSYSECLNYVYIKRDGIQILSNICPVYIYNGPLSQKTQGYSRFLNETGFQISLQYNSNKPINESTTLAIIGSNEQLLQLGPQPSDDSLTCQEVSIIKYIGPIETEQNQQQSNNVSTNTLEGDNSTQITGEIVQVICLTSDQEKRYYVLNLFWSVTNLECSQQHKYTVITFYAASATFLLLISVIFIRQTRIRRIAYEYIQLESQLTKYELDEEHFKEKYEILDEEVLGKGTFGVVKVCLQKPSRIALNYDKNLPTKRRAIKIINFAVNNSVIGQPSGSEFDEALILVQLQKYTNAVRLINYFSDKKTIYIVQELADSNLFTLIQTRMNKKQMFSNEEIVEFCIEVGFLLSLLHNNEAIAHRDLKPQNILIVDKAHYRLSDFGAAKILRIQNFYVQRTSIGSLNWMAPEMYSSCFGEFDPNRQYEMNYFKCDVFSLGLILLKMAAFIDIRGANKLVASKDAALARMRQSRPLLHPVLADLITSMLDFDPKQRIDMLEFKTIITDTFLAKTTPQNIILPDYPSSPPTLQSLFSNIRNNEPKRKIE